MDQEERMEGMEQTPGAVPEQTGGEAPQQRPEAVQEAPEPVPDPEPEAPPWDEGLMDRQRLEAERRSLEAERRAFEREKLESRVARALEQRGLGGEFAAYLTGADEAESLKRVEQFEGMFRRRLRAELEKWLGGSPAPREPRRARGFTREALRRMSPGEINRNWEAISRTLEG